MTSTFAPPTGPPVTASTVSPVAEPVPAAAPASGGRRRPFALAAAVVAVVALGIGAFVALGGRGSDDVVDSAQPFSLVAAAEGAITARTVDFDLTLSATDLAEITVSGAVDNESQLVSVTTDLSSLLALGDMPLPFGGGAMTVLVDGVSGIVYLDASALGGFLADGAAWVSIDLGALAEQSGQPLDDLQNDFALDPTDIARALLDTDDAVEVGTDTIDGVEVKQYRVEVDLADALAAIPQTELDDALGGAGLPAIDVPDTISYDVGHRRQPAAASVVRHRDRRPVDRHATRHDHQQRAVGHRAACCRRRVRHHRAAGLLTAPAPTLAAALSGVDATASPQRDDPPRRPRPDARSSREC